MAAVLVGRYRSEKLPAYVALRHFGRNVDRQVTRCVGLVPEKGIEPPTYALRMRRFSERQRKNVATVEETTLCHEKQQINFFNRKMLIR